MDLGQDPLQLLGQAAAAGGLVRVEELVGTDFTPELLDRMAMTGLHPIIVDRLRRAQRIGTPMAFGSDVYVEVPGKTRGALAASEVRTAIEAGITPRLIVQTMTVNAARLVGVDGDRGRIAVGQAADIVAVRGNPLESPAASGPAPTPTSPDLAARQSGV